MCTVTQATADTDTTEKCRVGHITDLISHVTYVTGVTNVYFMVARLIRFVLKGFVQSKVYSNNIK